MNQIHPTAIIGDSVVLGSDVTIGPFACIQGSTTIGDNVWIGAHAVIGSIPEVSSINHQSTEALGEFGVVIGNDTVIREAVLVQSGTHRATTIGRGSFIMNQAYVAHDVILGEGCVLSSGARLAGHVQVGAGSNFGMNSAIHQRTEIGRGAMIGMGAVIVRNVPGFAKVVGVPGRVIGLNGRALDQAGVSLADLQEGSAADGWEDNELERWL